MKLNQSKIDKIKALAQTYGATRLILFGSALDPNAEARDIDLACEGVGGWKLYELAAKLEEEFRILLDLVPLTPPNRFTKLIEANGKVLL